MTDEEGSVETRTDRNEIDEAALGAYLRHHVAGSEAAEKMARSLLERELDPEVRSFLERFTDGLEGERAFVVTALDQLGEGPGLIERGVGVATDVAPRSRMQSRGERPAILKGSNLWPWGCGGSDCCGER